MSSEARVILSSLCVAKFLCKERVIPSNHRTFTILFFFPSGVRKGKQRQNRDTFFFSAPLQCSILTRTENVFKRTGSVQIEKRTRISSAAES